MGNTCEVCEKPTQPREKLKSTDDKPDEKALPHNSESENKP